MIGRVIMVCIEIDIASKSFKRVTITAYVQQCDGNGEKFRCQNGEYQKDHNPLD